MLLAEYLAKGEMKMRLNYMYFELQIPGKHLFCVVIPLYVKLLSGSYL